MKNKHPKYDITWEQYFKLKTYQKRSCAICKTPFSEKSRVNVDHDHISGKVRGLLCGHCNRRLWAYENWEFIYDAIEYLKNPPLSIILKD